MIGLIGKKIGMTQRFAADGNAIPVTVIEAGPCTVVQVRTQDRDGYSAVQVGFGERKETRVPKAERGHAKASGREGYTSLVEFRVDADSAYEVGQQLTATEMLAGGDRIDVTGVSKGRGFAGVMKRHGFAGHRATHGTHESFRGGGAVGACAYPGRIFKGKRMAGRMGGRRRTIQNLTVVDVVEDGNLVLVQGSVPGAANGQVILRPAVKARKVYGGAES